MIGATDKIAGEAVVRPATWGELFATLHHEIGIDSHQATLTVRSDPVAGRDSHPLDLCAFARRTTKRVPKGEVGSLQRPSMGTISFAGMRNQSDPRRRLAISSARSG